MFFFWAFFIFFLDGARGRLFWFQKNYRVDLLKFLVNVYIFVLQDLDGLNLIADPKQKLNYRFAYC